MSKFVNYFKEKIQNFDSYEFGDKHKKALKTAYFLSTMGLASISFSEGSILFGLGFLGSSTLVL